jgi:NAD(P)-dependent dehydrogenase (short-subunit alcohol dehydrogenase family)
MHPTIPELLKWLVQASHGSIVNISSVVAQRPLAGAGAYCVSKAAVDMLTKVSALELGPKVTPLPGPAPS